MLINDKCEDQLCKLISFIHFYIESSSILPLIRGGMSPRIQPHLVIF